MPLVWEKVGVVRKMAWIAMLFLLLAVEYRAIDKDHADNLQTQKEALTTIGNGFSGIRQQSQQHFSATMTHIEAVESAQQALRAANIRVAQIISSPARPLKRRVAELSRDVLSFLNERAAASPKLGRPTSNDMVLWRKTMDDYEKQSEAFEAETGHRYLARFGSKVTVAVQSLKDEGVDVGNSISDRCNWAGSIGFTNVLQDCAVQLGALAEKLPR